ncbi:hypothetical protein ACTFIR_001039 [Dictyostelium discoideum]
MSTLESQQQNLSALQRLDSKICGVLGTSTHVTAYKFDESVKQWFRKDIEGSLFIVNTTEYPYCKLVVMNRLSTKNLVEEINEKIVIRIQGQYLIYKNKSGEINGIWFYEVTDQEKIYNLLKDLQRNPPQPPQQPQPLPQQQQQPLPQQPLPQQPLPQQPLPPQQQQPPPQQMQPQQPPGTMSPQGMIPPPGFIIPQGGIIPPHPQFMPQSHVYPYMMQPQQIQPNYNNNNNNNSSNNNNSNNNNSSNNNNNSNPPTPNKQNINDTPITPNTIINQIQQNSTQSNNSNNNINNNNNSNNINNNNSKTTPYSTTPQQLSPTIKKEVPLLSVLMNSVVVKENTITKDQIRETLKRLVNDENFIDLVYNSYINE